MCECVPGIGRWGLLVATGSLLVSDTPSRTSSAFWLEPENTRKVVNIIILTFMRPKLPEKIPSVCFVSGENLRFIIYFVSQHEGFFLLKATLWLLIL